MKLSLRITSLDRRIKTGILALSDAVLAALGTFLVLSFIVETSPNLATIIGIALFAGFVSIAFGAARIMIHAFGVTDFIRITAVAATISVAFLSLAAFGVGVSLESAAVLACALLCGFIWTRLIGSYLIRWMNRSVERSRVIIYGAGVAGRQLAGMLRSAQQDMIPIAFVDDNPALHGTIIGGMKVYPQSELASIMERGRAKKVLIAIPSLSRDRRHSIISNVSNLGGEVQILPSYLDLIRKENMLKALDTVDADDLLERDSIEVSLPQMRTCYTDRCVMVSGAGGSIGSELCHQVMRTKPARLILFEISEYALYTILMKLQKHPLADDVEIVPVLGSVCDRTLTTKLMMDHGVDVVLHAAAYKHVPLVEDNPLEAARNNVVGTQTMALSARDAGVERFVLVSTDKAVRPTNVMGATKRLAELVIQDLQTRSTKTIYSMVRFGNVLGSSGSVVPLFQKQIREGGPVTVTHPEITRYFMTIPEAARLVLLAGSYAEGGEVFVLDMGEPVKIADLARKLIEISGLTVKDKANPNGDIGINFVGLRPGEKLFEELLADGNTISTPHPKILRAIENAKSELEVAAALKKITSAVEARDDTAVRPILESMVSGYRAAKPVRRQNLRDELA